MPHVTSREAERRLGVSAATLRRWAKAGKIEHHVTPGGQRRHDVDAHLHGHSEPVTVAYARVSSPRQRDDLERQVAFLRARFPAAEIITDIGGGLNWNRRVLVALLERLRAGAKLRLVVAHKDRLARFGFDLVAWFVEANGGEVVVLGHTDSSPERELVEDLLAVVHSFSRHLHGLRRYRRQMQEDPDLSRR